MKLNQILAASEHLAAELKRALTNYISYFKNNQSDFKGIKKTYIPIQGFQDIESNRSYVKVTTTVDEKMSWLMDIAAKTLKNELDLEATNASGTAKAKLVLNDKEIGEFTSLELLRLKSFFSNPKLTEMFKNIPVRSDSKMWEVATEEEYVERSVFKNPTTTYEEKTTEKSTYILDDPNIQVAIAAGKEINYTPQQAIRTNRVTTGNGTMDTYSGEFSHHQRAEIQKRLSEILIGIKDALQRANNVDIVESTIDTDSLLSYLLTGE